MSSQVAFFLACGSPVFPNTIYRSDYPLPFTYFWLFWLFLNTLIDHICVGLLLGFLFCCIDLRLFLCQYHTVLIIGALKYGLKSGYMVPLMSFFFHIALAIWGFVHFHTNFRVICAIYVKTAIIILSWIAPNLEIALGSMDILTILLLSIHEHGLSLHLFASSISFIIVL